MKKSLLFILFTLSQLLFSQVEEVKNYEWEKTPHFKDIPQEFKDYPAVVLKDYRLFENRVSQYTYKAFVVKHCAIKILTEDGINDFNKVSINKKYVRDYRDLKARVIKQNGKIEELPKERIIEKENSDEKQFVFEGVEKGDIIEYYYVIKDNPDFNGVEYFQRKIPVLDGKFQVNDNISGATTYAVAYNGMKDESTKRQKIFTVTNLPGYKFESNATNYANVAKVFYFTQTGSGYGYTSFYQTLNEYADGISAKTMIKKLIEELKLNDVTIPLDDRLKKLDIYLKENLEIDNQDSYKMAIEDKKITPKMVLNLYKDVLDYLKVPYQFLVSTDKFENKLDQNQVVPETLSEILIYIPETKKYMSPFYFWMPYGPPNSVCVNNDAVYFEKTKTKTEYTFVKIGGVSMDDNIIKTDSEITIDDDMETVSVNKKMESIGYAGYYYRYAMKYVTEDKIKDYIKEEVFEDIDIDLKKYTIKNKEYKFNYDNNNPFTFETQSIVKESWIENAGKNYLFSIGKVLGKQTDLYQETERKYPVDLYYPKKYIHSIKLNIPAGYTVKSINNLLFNKQLKNEKNEVIGSFLSTAKIESNSILISIEEFYNFTHLDREKYNDYRDLINTAFDFYKSSIILSE